MIYSQNGILQACCAAGARVAPDAACIQHPRKAWKLPLEKLRVALVGHDKCPGQVDEFQHAATPRRCSKQPPSLSRHLLKFFRANVADLGASSLYAMIALFLLAVNFSWISSGGRIPCSAGQY